MFIISTFKNDNKNSISLLSIESNKSQISVKQCITITVQNIIVNIFHKQWNVCSAWASEECVFNIAIKIAIDTTSDNNQLLPI